MKLKPITTPVMFPTYNHSDDPSHDINAYHTDLAWREGEYERVYGEEMRNPDWLDLVAATGMEIFDEPDEQLNQAVKSNDETEIGRIFLKKFNEQKEKWAKKAAEHASGLEAK